MKKRISIILAALFLILSFSACDNSANNNQDNHSVINYTDTGESPSSKSGITADIEHNIESSQLPEDSGVDTEKEKQDEENTDNKNSSLSSSSQKSSSAVSSEYSSNTDSTDSNNTVKTITYYFENPEVPDDPSSTKNNDTDSDMPLDTDTDTDTDVQDDTDTEAEDTDTEIIPSDGSFTLEDIALLYNGEKIRLFDEISSVVEAVGEPKDIDANTYNYDDFWILVSSPNDSEEQYVEEIQIFGDTLETEKGIKTGMTLEDVIRVYGDSSTFIDDEQRYYAGNECMYFYIQNGIVGNIGYRVDHTVDNGS